MLGKLEIKLSTVFLKQHNNIVALNLETNYCVLG